MIPRLLKDPIVRVATLLWLATAALYFLPGVPADFLERMGDRYSTLSLWPWAAAACVYGQRRVANGNERRFWILQAASFASLLAIEVPWALARAGDTAAWNIAAEWFYFVYYGCQLMSAARTRAGVVRAGLIAAAAAASLSAMAIKYNAIYDPGWPSYITYLAFDASMAVVFWRRCRDAAPGWKDIFTGLALTSLLILATDALDMLSYEQILNMPAGMRTDILWTLPPLCYALVARFGHQRLETPA